MRLRITYSKSGTLRYIGHLDMHTIWERTCRRARIPLKYSQGFHPQPKISIGCALPLGFIGKAELVEIQLDEELDVEFVKKTLQEAAPPGLSISSIEIVDQGLPALQTLVDASDYVVEFLDQVDAAEINKKVMKVWEANSITRERKGKQYDLRTLLLSLDTETKNGNPVINMKLRTAPGATGRPEEVLKEMGIRPENTRITRTALHLLTPETSPIDLTAA